MHRPATRNTAFLLCALLACGANGGDSGASTSGASAQDLRVASLEMRADGGSAGLGDVAGLAVTDDGSVIVGDAANAQIVRFDSTGRVAARIGQRGANNGEYVRLQWVGACAGAAQGAPFVAHDIALSRLSHLSNALSVTSMRIIPKVFDSRDVAGCLADGRVLILNDSLRKTVPGVQRRPLALVAYDARTGRADTLRGFAGTQMNYVRHLGTSIAVPLGAHTMVSVAGRYVVVAESDRDSLWRFDAGQWRAMSLADVPAPTRPTAEDDKRARLALTWAPRTVQDRNFAPGLLAETATARMGPRIDAMVAAEDGTAWIGFKPNADGTRDWVAYDVNGKRTQRTRTSWTLEPRVVRGERWWGVERDSLGVETVVRYRVR